MTLSTQIQLASRPDGAPVADNFRTQEVTVSQPRDGELLLRVLYLSLDPYMRGRMSAAKSYAAGVELGQVITGGTVCEVLESRDAAFSPGDIVLSHSGWQTHAVAHARAVRRLDPSLAPITTALGVLGMPGFTAYAGLFEIGRPEAGETVVVAAATGPVGSVVGQIARLKGARAVGIAGGPRKCRALLDEFGFDAAVDHRAENFAELLAGAVPDGIDVYFENVGGHVTNQVLRHLNPFARIPVCGVVAEYNATQAPEGPDRLPGFLRQCIVQSLTVRGFLQNEFAETHHDRFLTEMSGWIADGSVRYREDIVDGLANAPEAFIGLLNGKNFGKLLVRVHGGSPDAG
jgi:NADPH-dependent curcumin reductase CurA